MTITVRDCKYVWVYDFRAGLELTEALDEEVAWGDAAMTLVEPVNAIAALEKWLEDASQDLDEAEYPEYEVRVRETISQLKSLGEDVYVALN